MTSMLHHLVEDVAVELQTHLPQDWLPANEDHEGLIDRLWQSGLLDLEALIALLLRRADEERIGGACRARQSLRSTSVVQPLVSHEDGAVAAAAMAVLIARGRRKDRFGQVVVELDDLDHGTAALLVHRVAAGLSERKPAQISASDAEARLAAAAEAVLARHDPAKALDTVTAALVSAIDAAGLLDDSWVHLAIDCGDIAILAQSLAARAQAPYPAVVTELLSRDTGRTMLILRLASLSRDTAGHLLARLGDLLGVLPDSNPLAMFDSFASSRLANAQVSLTSPQLLKDALKALGHGHRNGSV